MPLPAGTGFGAAAILAFLDWPPVTAGSERTGGAVVTAATGGFEVGVVGLTVTAGGAAGVPDLTTTVV
jgi:hypothetical protein